MRRRLAEDLLGLPGLCRIEKCGAGPRSRHYAGSTTTTQRWRRLLRLLRQRLRSRRACAASDLHVLIAAPAAQGSSDLHANELDQSGCQNGGCSAAR